MSDQHRLDEVFSGRSSEGISNVQDCPEGSSQYRPNAGLKTGNDPYNYEEDKYPEDKIYEETAPNARVWKTYVDERKNHDARMVVQLRDSVDVLLVFAGLFSAVVTTFVAQTSQSLQADYAQVSAALLFEMVLIQRTIANGSSLDNVPVSSLNPYTKFTPATTDVWVNGLWFTSLSLSLATALVAVLVKQWLLHYLALPSGTPQEQSYVRQFRYRGFQKWHVLVIVGLLPVLMHLALGIFFVGLIIFLVPLRPGLSWVIGVGTVGAYATYLITIFLPILYPQCPYRTPLSDLVYFPYRYITQDLFHKHVLPLFVKKVQEPNSTFDEPGAKISSLDDLERGVVQDESETLSVEALHWLFSSSFNPTVHGIVIESIGGLPLSAKAAVNKVFGEATHIRQVHDILLYGCMQYLGDHSFKPWPGMESKVERLLRFELFIPDIKCIPNIEFVEQLRSYVDAADDEGLTVAVHSNDTLQRSIFKSPKSPTSTAFFRQIILSKLWPGLPPVIWLGLMRTANNDGAFARIDINSLDVFPMHLCRYILPWKPPMPEDTLRRVPFEIAVQDHFPEEFTANMLNMISAFDILADKTSFPPTFTFALAFVRYLLHRLSLSSSLDTDTKSAVVLALHNVQSYVKFKDLPDDQVVALSDLVEYVVIHSLVFKLGPEWTGPQISLVKLYSAMVGVSSLHRPRYSPRHTFWPALRPLVEFLINQYDAPHHHIWSEHAPFDIMCDILGFGLEHGVQTVYDVFLETRCLDVFGDHSLRPSLIRVINGYVAGLAASHASIDSQRHLDYLHEPGNLFLACCILATNGWNAFSGKPRMIEKIPARLSGEICRDVRALASLRPSDPSWDPCRRKLRDLLQNDEREFFVKQQKWSMCGFKVLKPEAIDEAKNNIRLALDELDGFISDSKNMNLPFSMHRHESMALRFLGGICQYLQYPRRRERDEVQV